MMPQLILVALTLRRNDKIAKAIVVRSSRFGHGIHYLFNAVRQLTMMMRMAVNRTIKTTTTATLIMGIALPVMKLRRSIMDNNFHQKPDNLHYDKG